MKRAAMPKTPVNVDRYSVGCEYEIGLRPKRWVDFPIDAIP
jgi:hypothetical protein